MILRKHFLNWNRDWKKRVKVEGGDELEVGGRNSVRGRGSVQRATGAKRGNGRGRGRGRGIGSGRGKGRGNALENWFNISPTPWEGEQLVITQDTQPEYIVPAQMITQDTQPKPSSQNVGEFGVGNSSGLNESSKSSRVSTFF